ATTGSLLGSALPDKRPAVATDNRHRRSPLTVAWKSTRRPVSSREQPAMRRRTFQYDGTAPPRGCLRYQEPFQVGVPSMSSLMRHQMPKERRDAACGLVDRPIPSGALWLGLVWRPEAERAHSSTSQPAPE